MPIPLLIPAMAGFVGVVAATEAARNSHREREPWPHPPLQPSHPERCRMLFFVGRQDGIACAVPNANMLTDDARASRWGELYLYAHAAGFDAGAATRGLEVVDPKQHRPKVPPLPRSWRPARSELRLPAGWVSEHAAYESGFQDGQDAARRLIVHNARVEAEQMFEAGAVWSAWDDGWNVARIGGGRPPRASV